MRFKESVAEVINYIGEGKTQDAVGMLEWLSENADRYTKVNLGLFINAQSLIDMAQERL